MSTLENVKLLLSINDNVQDDLLKRIIDNTEKRLISLLPIGSDEVPDRLEYIVEEVAVKRFNRVGAEGMTQESVDGRSNTFQANDFDEYMDVIDQYTPRNSDKRGGYFLLRYNKRVVFAKETKGQYNPKTSRTETYESATMQYHVISVR